MRKAVCEGKQRPSIPNRWQSIDVSWLCDDMLSTDSRWFQTGQKSEYSRSCAFKYLQFSWTNSFWIVIIVLGEICYAILARLIIDQRACDLRNSVPSSQNLVYRSKGKTRKINNSLLFIAKILAQQCIEYRTCSYLLKKPLDVLLLCKSSEAAPYKQVGYVFAIRIFLFAKALHCKFPKLIFKCIFFNITYRPVNPWTFKTAIEIFN